MHACDRLSALDAAPLHYVSENGVNHGASLSIIDGKLPFEDYVHDLEVRIPYLPRLRQIVTPVPFNLAYPTWETAPNFHLTNHVRHVHLESPGSWAQLVDLAARLFSSRLPGDQPHWSAHLISGLEGNRTALFIKMHHAVADGAGAEEFQRVLYGKEPPIHSGTNGVPLSLSPNAGTRLWWGVRDNVRTGVSALAGAPQNVIRFVRWVFSPDARKMLRLQRAFTNAQAVRLPFNSPCCGEIKLAFTQYSLDELKHIGRSCDATINDVLLAMLGQAVSRYAQAHGIETFGKALKVHMPVNMRRDDQPRNMGNVATILPVLVPLDGLAAKERLQSVSQFTRALKQCRAAVASYETVKCILFCLTPIFAPVAQHHASSVRRQRRELRRPPKVNLVLSNVPRRPVPLYVAGHPILMRYAMGPPPPHIGITCLAFSCGSQLGISFSANAEGAADLNELCRFLDQAYQELRSASSGGD